MGIFISAENRVRCGRCSTEFDLNKNKSNCPLCKFGPDVNASGEAEKSRFDKPETEKPNTVMGSAMQSTEFVGIPPIMDLDRGRVTANAETRTWGAWIMFNDIFAPKFLMRVLAWKAKGNQNAISVYELIETAIQVIKKYNLSALKGFPKDVETINLKNLEKENAVCRLVYHFLKPATQMGLFKVSWSSKAEGKDDVWSESWRNINVTSTKEGLEFARLKNPVFDDNADEQVLSQGECDWLIKYLKSIDAQGFKEYSTLREVCSFLKSGERSANDLWYWFQKNDKYATYVKQRSKKARDNPKLLKQQMENYAASFMSSKISLLRELRIVRNKRNDYTLIGSLEATNG